MPSLGELGPDPIARMARFVHPLPGRRQSAVEPGHLAPDAGRQPFAVREGLCVGVVLVVCLRELASRRLEARAHAVEITLDSVVRLRECAGAAGEQKGWDPDAHGAPGPPRMPCAVSISAGSGSSCSAPYDVKHRRDVGFVRRWRLPARCRTRRHHEWGRCGLAEGGAPVSNASSVARGPPSR